MLTAGLVFLGTTVRVMASQAQGESLIRKALTELQLWGLQRSFAFLSSNDTKPSTANSSSSASSTSNASAAGTRAGSAQSNTGVPLIKDWAGVLSEVGDHQSLVASLKTSPYYTMFKVGAGSWQPSCQE